MELPVSDEVFPRTVCQMGCWIFYKQSGWFAHRSPPTPHHRSTKLRDVSNSLKGRHFSFCGSISLPLFGPGGGTLCPLCHVFAHICPNTRTSALKKLDFSHFEFGKGQYTFYPVKLSRFLKKNKVRQKYQNFIRGDPYKSGQTPLWHVSILGSVQVHMGQCA